jgi:hypothetical protein
MVNYVIWNKHLRWREEVHTIHWGHLFYVEAGHLTVLTYLNFIRRLVASQLLGEKNN